MSDLTFPRWLEYFRPSNRPAREHPTVTRLSDARPTAAGRTGRGVVWACLAAFLAGGLVPEPARAQDPPSGDAAESIANGESEAEKSLRFNFRRQPWEQVLEWLAEQADLSLVMDAPPPGSFNYADTKAYSVSEAIDLVNGVLASKGYTLLRRERMLTLVNLQGGVPRVMVPRIPLEEVPQRGRYEFVTVAFPLEGRNAEAVLAEVQPLMSSYGEASALAASGQLLVTERAGIMRLVSGVIDSIPRPSTPTPPAKKTAEKPTFEVYDLGGADAEGAIELITAIVDAKVAHDPAGDRLNVYATAGQHAIVSQLMQQVQTSTDKRQRRLEVYPLDSLSAERQTQLTADLQAVAVEALLRFDAENDQLIVWATETQHLEIRRALFTLLAAGYGGDNQTATIYSIEHIGVDTAAELLRSVLPETDFKQIGSGNRLLALASPREQKLVAQLIEQLDLPRDEAPPLIKEYALEQDPPEELAGLLAEAAPDATIRIDASRRSVIATGDQQAHDRIAAIVDSVTQNLQPRGPQELSVFVLSDRQRKRFADTQSLAEQVAPDARITFNESSGELLVWSTPEEHREIAALLETLDSTAGREKKETFRAYPAHPRFLEAATTMIQELAPEAVTAVDPSGRRLLVWAKQDDHLRIEKILQPEAPAAEAASNDEAVYRAYPAGGLDMALVQRLMGEVFPTADFEPDATAQSLVARAPLAAHPQIEAFLKELRSGSQSAAGYRVEVYPLGNIEQTQAQGLSTLFPSMRLSIDPGTHQLAAWGTQQDHDALREALDSLGGGGAQADDPSWRLETFSLEHASAAEVAVGLERLAPGVSAAAVNASQLLVRCRADQTDDVGRLIEQLDQRRDRSGTQRAHTLPVKFADPDALLATLRALFPTAAEAYFSYDPRTEALLAVVDAEQLALVKEIVAAADQRRTGVEGERTLKVHSLAGIDQTTAMSTLEELFQERGLKPQLSTDVQQNRLIAVAGSEEQQLIAETLDALRPADTSLEVFTLETMDPYDAQLAIEQLFAGRTGDSGAAVEIEADSEGGRILVRATEEQLADIRSLLLKLGETQDGSRRRSAQTGDFGVYPLQNAGADRIVAVLKDVYSRRRGRGSQLEFSADDRINAVVVVGSRSDRREVEAMLATLDKKQTSEYFNPLEPVMISLEHASARQVYAQLQTLYKTELQQGSQQPPLEIPPGASPELVATLQQINASREGPLLSLEVDADSNSLLVIAPSRLLEEIRSFVSQIDERSMDSRVGVRVLQLDTLSGDELIRSLENIVIERK